MSKLGNYIRQARTQRNQKVHELAADCRLDPSLISRFESGKRLPTQVQIKVLSEGLHLDYEIMRKLWAAERVFQIIQYEQNPREVLIAAEERITYLTKTEIKSQVQLSKSIQAELEELTELHKQWQSLKPLNNTQLAKMKEYFNIEYTYESNRIEGNTLTLQETELVVNQGITISGKSMIEHLEAINHSEASDYIYDLARTREDIDRRIVSGLHALILKSIDRHNAGQYRKVPVRISGSKHEPPQPFEIEKLMEDYFLFYKSEKDRLHPVILAAEMHERLVSIHPFIDGNGRTSRLVMNLILLRHGYTIANLKGDLDSRMSYYKSLEEVQINNNSEIYHRLIIDTVRTSLKRHIELC